MVSAQLILVSLAIIAFFATGGRKKITIAKETIQQDFEFLKMKKTDFVTNIKAKNEAGKMGKEG